MTSAELHASAPGLHADDAEIALYASLLDRLDIGLVVYATDASVLLRNAQAAALLGEAALTWVDETGQPLAADGHPALRALHSGRPVHESVIGLSGGGAPSRWLKADALPILVDDGSVRCVLLTLLDVSQQKRLETEVEKLSLTDALTGVSKQIHIVELLENEIHRARRYGTPFTLAQIDIDQFLLLSETHGQSAGDEVLADFGRLLRGAIREIDMVGRIGLDAFLLILPNIRLNDAMVGLERIRALIEAHEFSKGRVKVTISGGVTEYTGESAMLMIERSKSLLVEAWEHGRNRLAVNMEIF